MFNQIGGSLFTCSDSLAYISVKNETSYKSMHFIIQRAQQTQNSLKIWGMTGMLNSFREMEYPNFKKCMGG